MQENCQKNLFNMDGYIHKCQHLWFFFTLTATLNVINYKLNKKGSPALLVRATDHYKTYVLHGRTAMAVNKMNGYGSDGLDILLDSREFSVQRHGQVTHHHVKWVGLFPHKLKRRKCETNNWPPHCTEVKNERTFTSTPPPRILLHGAVLVLMYCKDTKHSGRKWNYRQLLGNAAQVLSCNKWSQDKGFDFQFRNEHWSQCNQDRITVCFLV
jgi:hypothetical protein